MNIAKDQHVFEAIFATAIINKRGEEIVDHRCGPMLDVRQRDNRCNLQKAGSALP
jgi:hypothetical protein